MSSSKSSNVVYFGIAIIIAAICFLTIYFSGHKKVETSYITKKSEAVTIVSPDQALEMLKAGNQRFTTTTQRNVSAIDKNANIKLLSGQAPFATILACSDSRFPPETFFNAGIGQLFVVRNAGNQLSTDALGSIEYASLQLTSRLIVVMGHQACGAVSAAEKFIRQPGPGETPALNSIVCNLIPVVLIAGKKNANISKEKLITAAIRENVRLGCRLILQSSEPLRKMEAAGELKVIGAYADLETGKVEFFQP
ncbi:MAG: carbonic anhydrase [Victivallaceae bacterium]